MNVRGYGWNSLGPRDQNYNLGGDIMANFGLHSYFPLPFAKSSDFIQDNFRFHLFSNAGCVQSLDPNFGKFGYSLN